jgi:hypothetical protein
MIYCKGDTGFRLGAYLNQLDAKVTFQDGQTVALNEYGFNDQCIFQMEHMIHEFWAVGTAEIDSLEDGAARLEVEYRVFSYPGQGDPDRISRVVPVLARGLHSERWARRASAT